MRTFFAMLILWTMPTTYQPPNSEQISENPEIYAGSLAHVLQKENDKVNVIGQAWLAGANTLVTCGHVIEPFLSNSAVLSVRFPASGTEYTIDSIRLHPNFIREAGQLVKFDAAVLSIRLRGQELLAKALPIRYEQVLKNQDTIWTFRYPAHLGALSSASDPLKQSGKYLGRLRKEDSHHLLHDLALSPGDSGAPLFSREGVVGLHCGDTASLPGLNLPTTSIRLALLVDALKELGIERSIVPTSSTPRISFTQQLVLGALTAIIVLGVAVSALAAIYFNQQKQAAGVTVPAASIALVGASGDDSHVTAITVTTAAPSHLYVLFNKGNDKTFLVYPSGDGISKDELANGSTTIQLPDDLKSSWQSSAGDLLVVTMRPDLKLIAAGDLISSDGRTVPLLADRDAFWSKVKDNQRRGNAVSLEFEYPQSVTNATPQDGNAAKDGSAAKTDQTTNQAGSADTQ
jgi:hypothetical protein